MEQSIASTVAPTQGPSQLEVGSSTSTQAPWEQISPAPHEPQLWPQGSSPQTASPHDLPAVAAQAVADLAHAADATAPVRTAGLTVTVGLTQTHALDADIGRLEAVSAEPPHLSPPQDRKEQSGMHCSAQPLVTEGVSPLHSPQESPQASAPHTFPSQVHGTH